MKSNRNPPKTIKAGLVLGLSGFAKISAVEGVKLKASSGRMFAKFEKEGLSPQQRRKAIADKHAKKA